MQVNGIILIKQIVRDLVYNSSKKVHFDSFAINIMALKTIPVWSFSAFQPEPMQGFLRLQQGIWRGMRKGEIATTTFVMKVYAKRIYFINVKRKLNHFDQQYKNIIIIKLMTTTK